MSRTTRSTRPTSTTRSLAVALAAAALLAACGADDAPTVDGSDPAGGITESGAPATETTTDAASETATATAPDATGTVISLTVEGGTVSGADDRVTVALGDEVTLEVTADVEDEIHLHGYDLHADVVPGETAAITFTADIPGVFEAELEDAGIQLVELEVR